MHIYIYIYHFKGVGAADLSAEILSETLRGLISLGEVPLAWG